MQTGDDQERERAAVDFDLMLNENARRSLVARAAYFRAERRGFVPGQDIRDWLEAEQDLASELR
jgi:hypothetical protein